MHLREVKKMSCRADALKKFNKKNLLIRFVEGVKNFIKKRLKI